jgi:hypothetical protein
MVLLPYCDDDDNGDDGGCNHLTLTKSPISSLDERTVIVKDTV